MRRLPPVALTERQRREDTTANELIVRRLA